MVVFSHIGTFYQIDIGIIIVLETGFVFRSY